MELVSTMEISGEEREIADAYARGKCAANADGIAELNSNLSQLEFGEESGSGNLCDEEFILGYFNDKGQEFPSTNDIRTKNYIKVKPNTTYYLAGNDVVVVKLNESKTPIGYILWRKSNVAFTTDENTHYIGLARPGVTTYSHDIAIIEGASGSYVPYIPSVKMLAEENAQQSTEAMDLKMLGWSVPKECPIQNEVNGNQFIQKVGRADIGDLAVERQATDGNYFFHCILDVACESPTQDAYLDGYTVTTIHGWSNLPNLYYRTGEYMGEYFVRIRNDSYTDANSFKNAMKGHYFYYKLATPITKTIDGNEAVAQIKSDLSEKLKVISVSLSDVMVSAMSSTTVNLPQEYIDAGYVIANILSKPDTGLNYTTGSETSIIIRNNTDSAVAFAPTTTVKVLIAKIG